MRVLTVLALIGCSPSRTVPQTAAALPPTGQPATDASVASAEDGAVAPAREPATAIKPVEVAGPYRSLAESCKTAPPCGFTDMDERGVEITKTTKTDCAAVLDPTNDIVGHVPDSMTKTGAATAMTHRAGDTEIRIGGVVCAVPKGLRRLHSMYYVFVHRRDGWWRTTAPMFEYDFNDKYCGGAMYAKWNDKPARTIAGIAAEAGCLACSKQATSSAIAELMLRVETTGDKPAVYPFVPVGHRSRMETFEGSAADADCKPTRSAMSLHETWPTDDEVVLEGTPGQSVKHTEGLQLMSVVGDGTIRPGRYRFMR